MPHPIETDRALVAHFRGLLAARTDGDGHPKPGFEKNVALLHTEIASAEARIAAVEKPNV